VCCCRILFRSPGVERRNKWLFEVLMLTIKLRNGSLVIGGRFRKVAPKCRSLYISGITTVTGIGRECRQHAASNPVTLVRASDLILKAKPKRRYWIAQ